MSYEYKLENMAFKSVARVAAALEPEGQAGWEIHGAGPFYMFLARQDKLPRQHQVAPILFKAADAALKLVEEQTANGWRFASLSPSQIFFTRALDPDPAHAPAYFQESISLMTPGAIRQRMRTVGAEGWALRALTGSHALYERTKGSTAAVEHVLEGVLLRTAGMVQTLVEERAREGWRVACASRLFIAFTRAAPAA